MSWTDKAKEIADTVAAKHKGRVMVTMRQDELISLLCQAAYKGMEFECENWLNRPRKNQQTSETT